MDINIINTIELFQQYLKYVPTYATSIDDIIQRNGWIDERYVDNGICRIGNKRLVYDANSKPVIRIVDLTGISQMVPGVRRQKMKLTLDPEFYHAVDGVANRSRFITDAILAYRGHVECYSKRILRIPSSPDYKNIIIRISQQAQDVLSRVASRHQYIRDAVMAYQEYKQQYK